MEIKYITFSTAFKLHIMYILLLLQGLFPYLNILNPVFSIIFKCKNVIIFYFSKWLIWPNIFSEYFKGGYNDN